MMRRGHVLRFLQYLATVSILASCGYDPYKVAINCYPKKTSADYQAYTKEVSVFVGNLSFATDTDKKVDKLITGLADLSLEANKLNMRLCVYKGTQDVVTKASGNTEMRYFLWLGHGENGCLVDWDGSTRYCPESFSRFTSNQVARASFLSCQAGQRSADWRSVFINAPNSFQMDLNQDNMQIDEAISYMQTQLPNYMKTYF